MSPKLDLEFIRSQFPAFQEKSLENFAFFENAGGSYTCSQVIDRLFRYYKSRKVQPYSSYSPSREAGEEMDEARQRLSEIMGISPSNLSFGPSTTQNTYVLATAFGQYLKSGEAIIVTNQDHEANTGPWRRLAAQGIEIREWKMDPETGHLNPNDLNSLIDDKVRLLCFPHTSNVVGEVNDVKQICKFAKSAGIHTCVDGVSYAPHGIPNIADLGADIYLFSAYKTYGPHQGIMAMQNELAEILPNQAHYFNSESAYKRFTPAGPDHAQVAACAGMADYIEAVYAHHTDANATSQDQGRFVHDIMRAHEIELLQPILDYLASKNSVRLLGPKNAQIKAPTIALKSETAGEILADRLVEFGIGAGGGDFYANRCLEGQNIDPNHGVLRLSFVHYTSQEEVDKLLNALDHIL